LSNLQGRRFRRQRKAESRARRRGTGRPEGGQPLEGKPGGRCRPLDGNAGKTPPAQAGGTEGDVRRARERNPQGGKAQESNGRISPEKHRRMRERTHGREKPLEVAVTHEGSETPVPQGGGGGLFRGGAVTSGGERFFRKGERLPNGRSQGRTSPSGGTEHSAMGGPEEPAGVRGRL
jgi:hypothetical protein